MAEVRVICGESCAEYDDVEFTYEELLTSTYKAVQLIVREGENPTWLPFSQIVAHDRDEKTMRVTQWIAEEEAIEPDF